VPCPDTTRTVVGVEHQALAFCHRFCFARQPLKSVTASSSEMPFESRNCRSLHGTPGQVGFTPNDNRQSRTSGTAHPIFVAGTGGRSFDLPSRNASRLLLMNKRRVWCRTSSARPPAYGPSPSEGLCEPHFQTQSRRGRLNLAQDASPGLDLQGRPSPAGTAENGPRRQSWTTFSRPCGTQSCCTIYPGLASWAKFSRPYGTKLVNPGSHSGSSGLG
jgi:hypothetical protein